jgi:hypothetical protein
MVPEGKARNLLRNVHDAPIPKLDRYKMWTMFAAGVVKMLRLAA